MKETIVVNGKEYTRDQIIETINRVKEIAQKFINNVVERFRKITPVLKQMYKRHTGALGYKRLAKMDKLNHYEAYFYRKKSKNSRKDHGLHVIRNKR